MAMPKSVNASVSPGPGKASEQPSKLHPTHEGSRPASAEEVARFSINYRRYLDIQGNPVCTLPDFANKSDQVVPLYRCMMRTRTFDARAVSLQRTGQLGTFPSSLGQEGVSVGFASAMEHDDVLLGTYRETGAYLWRGVKMEELLMLWGGDERGGAMASGPKHDFPISIPIASHCLQAAGVGTAIKLRHQKRVAVCVLGDGATSKGDFYEAMNLVGVWDLPVVFLITNNQFAISMVRDQQSATETLAQKGIAAGLYGEQVEGNDVLAVHDAVSEALDRARNGDGGSVIECLTYRLTDHTTADDATRYRAEEEVSARWAEEPMVRLKNYIANKGWWRKEDEQELIKSISEEVEAAKELYLATEPEPATAIYDYVYGDPPKSLLEQKEKFKGGSHD